MRPFSLIAEWALFAFMPTFPTLTTVRPTFYNEEPREYAGDSTTYQDGGRDWRTNADTPVRKWTIGYENITTSEAAQFDQLAIDTKFNPREGSLLGCDFTPRGESLLSNVRITKYSHSRTKSWIHRVEIELTKFP